MTTKLYSSPETSCPAFVLDSRSMILKADIPPEFIPGTKPTAIKGKMLEEVFTGELGGHLKELWYQAMQGTDSRSIETIGQEQCLLGVVPFRDAEGRTLVRYSIQKISGQKVKNSNSIATEEKFKATFESGFSHKLIIDDELKIIEANHTFREFCSPNLPEDPEGLPLVELQYWKPVNINHLEMAIKKATLEGEQRYIENLQVDNTHYFFEISVKTIKGSQQTEPSLYMVEMRDVTRLEKSNTELSECRLQLQKQTVDFRKISKMVSHDLRGPATNMSYLLSLLDESDGVEIDPELMKALKSSVEKMLNTIEQVGSDLNDHMEATSAASTTSLRRTIDEAVESLKDEIAAREARVVVDIYDNSDWDVPPGILKMAVAQLVSNSLRFSKKDEDPKIIITAFRQNGQRILRVKDNGIGINLEGNEQRLFGMFQTFHQHPEARGVGLFQVKNRLKSIGGDVSLESEVGKGTTVSLNFN